MIKCWIDGSHFEEDKEKSIAGIANKKISEKRGLMSYTTCL